MTVATFFDVMCPPHRPIPCRPGVTSPPRSGSSLFLEHTPERACREELVRDSSSCRPASCGFGTDIRRCARAHARALGSTRLRNRRWAMSDTVLMTVEDGVAVLTLNRPDKL